VSSVNRTDALTDEEVVRVVLRGAKEDFAILVRRYQGRIVAHVRRIVGDREVALEIAQEAFMKAYQALARFDPRYRFSTWLYAIAGNAAIDHLRRRRPEVASLDEPLSTGDGDLHRDPPGPARTAEDIVGSQDIVRKVEAAIGQLPEAYREILLMRHPGGLSYDEIAEAKQMPLGTVKNRIFRARQRLKEILGDVLPADI
jgi:RNA polymerase sigma-70 factor (ECF subfamily)